MLPVTLSSQLWSRALLSLQGVKGLLYPYRLMKYIVRDMMVVMSLALCEALAGFAPSLLYRVISLFRGSFPLFVK